MPLAQAPACKRTASSITFNPAIVERRSRCRLRRYTRGWPNRVEAVDRMALVIGTTSPRLDPHARPLGTSRHHGTVDGLEIWGRLCEGVRLASRDDHPGRVAASSAALSASSSGTPSPPRPWSVVVWRRPPSSAVHTSVAPRRSGRRSAGVSKKPDAAIAVAQRVELLGGHRAGLLPHRLLAAERPPAALEARVDGAQLPRAAVGGDAIHVGGVARLDAALEQQRLRGLRQPWSRRLRTAPGSGSRPRRSGAGRPAWGRCPTRSCR